MKVIMLKDLGGVGRRGTVVEASDGYALNHLIANGFAQQATPEKIKAHEEMTKKETAAKQKEQQALIGKVQGLEGARIEIKARATQKGGLFKSLGVPEIQKAIHEQKNTYIPSECIVLEKPIKEIGEHEVQLKAAGVKSRLLVAISAN